MTTDNMIAEINMRNAMRRKGEDMRKISSPIYNRPGQNTLAFAIRRRLLRRKARQERESGGNS